MKPHKVYLAGPITGLDFDGAADWRNEAIAKLKPIAGMSPMRGKEFLKPIGVLSGTAEEYGHLNVMASPRGIMTRDRYDCTTCDVLLVNFKDAKRVSIGTVMEVAWADANRIPIVCIMEKGNVHEHAMIAEAIGYRVDTLEEAVRVIRILLLGTDEATAA